jgi:hypothetical protein
MTTEERFEKLERELAITTGALRRNRQLMAAGALAILGCLTMAAVRDTQVIRAEKFIVTDDLGHERALLGMYKGVPALVLDDETGNNRVLVTSTGDGPDIAMSDENGKARVELTVTKDRPVLRFRDENERVRIGLGATGESDFLEMNGENGKPCAILGTDKDEPDLSLFDVNGKFSADLQINNGGAGLMLSDENSKPRAELEMNGGGPELGLFDENGNPLGASPNGAGDSDSWEDVSVASRAAWEYAITEYTSLPGGWAFDNERAAWKASIEAWRAVSFAADKMAHPSPTLGTAPIVIPPPPQQGTP